MEWVRQLLGRSTRRTRDYGGNMMSGMCCHSLMRMLVNNYIRQNIPVFMIDYDEI